MITRLAIAALIAAGCTSRSDSAPADSATDNATDNATDSAVDSASAPSSNAAESSGTSTPGARPEIWIDTVIEGNPLVVRGHARTFENTVQVRVRDTDGGIVTEVFETSVGEMGNHNPFEARVWLVRDPGPVATVESFEYSAKDGSVRSLTSKRVAIDGARATVTVLFPTSECTTTKPFARAVPRAVGVAQLLAHVLVAGPTDAERSAGATQPFPPGSRVRSVVLRDGVLTVDFNERLQNVGGSCAAQAIRAAVTGTMTRLTGVRRVVITAAGSEALALQP